ncbi:MAG: YHS domain-containing protein [Anaerolineales bacterium]
MDQSQGNPMLKTVCGSEIQDPDKYPGSLYGGKVVYFCTGACLKAFQDDPDRFIAGEIEHPEDGE